MRWPVLPSMFFLLLAPLATAQAQNRPAGSRLFVAAHVAPKWDDVYGDLKHIKDKALQGGVAFGSDSRTSGAEVGVSVSNWHVRPFFASGSQYATLYPANTTSILRRRSSEVAILYRRNWRPNDRVTLTWLGGAASIFRTEERTRLRRVVRGVLMDVDPQTERSDHTYIVGVVGLDVAVKVYRNLSVVPRLRLNVHLGGGDTGLPVPQPLFLHPQIAVRWTF